MASFNAYRRIVERAIDDSSDLGTRVSAEVDAAVMAATPKEAGRHANKAVRILQKNGRYATRADAALTGMVTKHQEVVDENYDLTNKNNDLQNENSSLGKKVQTWIYRAVIGTVSAGVLGLGIGYATGSFSKADASEPAPIVRSIEETVKPTVMPTAVENTDLYTIETLSDGSQRLKISKEALAREKDSYFIIPDGAKDTLVTYINKAELYDAKKGKLGTRVHFHPKELEFTLKELYSQSTKSAYGDKDKLVKRDIEAAIKEMGE
jgi:hypothetical protein